MRYKIETLEEVSDAKSFMKSYQASCSYQLLKYVMYLILATLITILVWSLFARKDLVVDTYGSIDVKDNKCQIYIENTSIGNIMEGNEVQIEVISLARNEYGIISSKVDKVSDDVVVDQNSKKKFYSATCALNQTVLTNKAGDKVALKNGMEAKISIVCGRTTYFNYIVDKLR